MRRSRITGLVIVLVVLASSAWMHRPAIASTPPIWGEPVPIGHDLPFSWFPEIHADPAGNVLLSWNARLTEVDANITHAINGGVMVSELGSDGWTLPADIFVMDGGIASRPIITSDGQYAHLIMRWSVAGAAQRLYYMRATLSADLGNAHSWSEPFPLSEGPAYWGQYRVLPDGSHIVVFNQREQATVDGEPEIQTDLFARRSTDQGQSWGPLIRISDSDDRVGRSSLAVSPDGEVLLAAWDEGYDSMSADSTATAVSVAMSLDGGQSWQEHQTFTGTYEQAVVSTDGETAVLIYRTTSDDILYYRTSDDDGRSWSAHQPIPGAIPRPYLSNHHFDKISTAYDGDGRLLLAYVGTDPQVESGHSVMVTTFFDGTWTPPEVVASPEGFPEYPRIAVALGNQIHLTYFVRPDLFELGHYTLWAMAGRSDASPVEPAVFEQAPVAEASPVSLPPIEIAQAPPIPEPYQVDESSNTDEIRPQSVINKPVIRASIATGIGLVVVLLLFAVLRRLGSVRI